MVQVGVQGETGTEVGNNSPDFADKRPVAGKGNLLPPPKFLPSTRHDERWIGLDSWVTVTSFCYKSTALPLKILSPSHSLSYILRTRKSTDSSFGTCDRQQDDDGSSRSLISTTCIVRVN